MLTSLESHINASSFFPIDWLPGTRGFENPPEHLSEMAEQ